jgi:uncharacterized protein YegP (UPF0339 family)
VAESGPGPSAAPPTYRGPRRLSLQPRTYVRVAVYLACNPHGSIIGVAERDGDHQQKGKIVKFRIKPARGGFRGYIIARNGEILFWTEVYTRRAGARHACELVKAGAATAPIQEL